MRAQVPSDQGIPFNEKPAMKSAEITELAIDALKSGKYNEVLCTAFATCMLMGMESSELRVSLWHVGVHIACFLSIACCRI